VLSLLVYQNEQCNHHYLNDSIGKYRFDNLDNGDYIVHFDKPANLTQTTVDSLSSSVESTVVCVKFAGLSK
jgi:hypothetical protein